MTLTPKRILGTLFSLVFTAFLLTGLLVLVNLTQKSQDVKRGQAAGETVTLSMSPSTTGPINVNDEFTVTLNATPNNGAKITAITGAFNFSSNLQLVSVTRGTLFTEPAYTEQLSLGTNCTTATVGTACRTAASGVTCPNNYCVNSTYTSNSMGFVRFDVGASCDITHYGCINNQCAVVRSNSNSTADTEGCSASVTSCTGGSGNVAAQCYPATAGGVVAIVRFKATAAGTATVNFDTANTKAAALDSSNPPQPANGNQDVKSISGSGVSLTVNGTGGGVSLPFKVKFQGVTAAYSANCPARNVRIILKPAGGTTEVARQTINVTADTQTGIYSGTMTGIPAGEYDVYLKGPAHITAFYPEVNLNTTPSTAVDWSGISQRAGDLVGSMITARTNPDNAIDGEDWNRVLNNINSLLEIDPMSNFMDLNCDKRVEATDLITILNNIILEYGPGGEE
jgi:hypothetical protein